ncbi:MAG TPA: BNR-4 repeat-containing protein, partial [Bacteroidales bacterium]|nr:BNR-4 repeat-containing protein [Bacteroidales bacterium]
DDLAVTATDVTGNGVNGIINGGIYKLSHLFDPMEYIQSRAIQQVGYVNTGTADNVMMRLDIETSNLNHPLRLTKLYLSANESTALADISHIKVFAGGNDSVVNTGSLVAEITGNLSSPFINLGCDYSLVQGNNYFWLTCDVSKEAVKGDMLNLRCDSLVLSDTAIYIPGQPVQQGSLTVNPDLFIKNVRLPEDIVTVNGQSSIEGANFASFQQNAIMTYRGYQYVTYWNKNKQVCISRKKMPDGEWKELVFADYISPHDLGDNHYTISMGICANDGTIHLAFDHHNDVLHYRKSVVDLANKPKEIAWNMASFGTIADQLVFGSQVSNVTYPRFISMNDGDLLYECRLGWSGDGDDFLWQYTASSGSWEYVGEYLNGTSAGENAYINGMQYDSTGLLHVSWVWRQTPDARTNHDIYYGYSDDNGRTWYNAEGIVAGSVNSNPMNMNSPGLKVWSVGTYRGLINQESQAVDSKGGIHILQSYIPDDQPDNGDFWGSRINEGYLRHIYQDESGNWHNDIIARSTRNRSEIGVDANDNLYVVAPNYRVYYASAADGWKTWMPFDLSETNNTINEGLLDREALQNGVLSFVFAHHDNDGKIIVPHYLLDMLKPGYGEGLNITFYNDSALQVPVSQQLDSVNVTMVNNTVTGDFFSLSCTGVLESHYAEAYTLYLTTSGNTKVWINDSLKIETGELTAATEFNTPLEIEPTHRYHIRIEGVYRAKDITTRLEWSSYSQKREIVPRSALYGTLTSLPENVLPLVAGTGGVVKAYPNPFTDAFTLQANGNFEYQVFDTNGRLVENGQASDQCELGQHLQRGAYLVRVIQHHQLVATKLMIKQ